jgi:hypothetical protein
VDRPPEKYKLYAKQLNIATLAGFANISLFFSSAPSALSAVHKKKSQKSNKIAIFPTQYSFPK